MPEIITAPIPLARWLESESGFAWILEARQSPDPAERARAQRAWQALDASLRRIVAAGGRGWVKHRAVHYLLLVESDEQGLRAMTLARSMWYVEDAPNQPPFPASAGPAAHKL